MSSGRAGFDLELTFPPSFVFFDKHSLRLSYGTQRFMEPRHAQAKEKAREVLSKALADFSIGDFGLEPLQLEASRTGARELLLADLREKLFGKTVKAIASVIEASDRAYFIPRQVDGVF